MNHKRTHDILALHFAPKVVCPVKHIILADVGMLLFVTVHTLLCHPCCL